MDNFNDFHQAIVEFMRESGKLVTLKKTVEGEYDPALGTIPMTEVEIPVKALMMDLTLQSNGLSVKYNTAIEAGDKEIYVQPNRDTPFTIQTDDRILFGSIEYKVVTMKEINPTGDDPIVFMLYCRR